MTYQDKANDIWQAVNKLDNFVVMLHGVANFQAMLSLLSAKDLAALHETIRCHPYGFDEDYKQALLNLVSKAQNGDLD